MGVAQRPCDLGPLQKGGQVVKEIEAGPRRRGDRLDGGDRVAGVARRRRGGGGGGPVGRGLQPPGAGPGPERAPRDDLGGQAPQPLRYPHLLGAVDVDQRVSALDGGAQWVWGHVILLRDSGAGPFLEPLDPHLQIRDVLLQPLDMV